MARLQAFPGIHYEDFSPEAEEGVLDLTNVIAARSQWSPAQLAANPSLWGEWLGTVLAQDDEPTLYLLRSGRRLADGTPIQSSGIFGLGGDTAVTDPIDPLVIQIDNPAFIDLLVPSGVPLARATTPDGTHHRIWRINQNGVIETIADAVDTAGGVPEGVFAFVTADGADPPLGLVFAPLG